MKLSDELTGEPRSSWKRKALSAVRFCRRCSRRILYPLGIHRTISYIRSFNQRDAVFIWIPRTAGYSLSKFLNRHHCPKLKSYYAAKYCFCQRGLVTFAHQSYPKLLEKQIVSQEFDNRAFKFCFVRNPFDRAVSLYFYLKKIGILREDLSFGGFAHILQDTAVAEVGLYNKKGLSQCNSQMDWLRDSEGKVFVEFVGRFENLEEDFKKICCELGLSGRLPDTNRTRHSHYRDYYDDETRKIIENVYSDDIEHFSYEF